MNYLHYLSSNPELKTQKIRDAILSSDFSDYCTAVKKAESS